MRYWPNDSPSEFQLMVASPSGTSFFGTRFMVGFGGLSIEPPLLLSMLMQFWTWELLLSLKWGACTMGAPIFTLVAFGDMGNFSSGMTLCCNSNLFCWYLAPSGVDITYDLGLFSSGVDTTVTGCHRLTLGACCSHTSCWVGVMVASWHGHYASIFLSPEKTVLMLYGALVTVEGLF